MHFGLPFCAYEDIYSVKFYSFVLSPKNLSVFMMCTNTSHPVSFSLKKILLHLNFVCLRKYKFPSTNLKDHSNWNNIHMAY